MTYRLFPIVAYVAFALIWPWVLFADEECIYVNSRIGNDADSGTVSMPLQTIQEAAIRLGRMKGHGAFTIKIESGVYAIKEPIVLATDREFTDVERLVIEATMLPEDDHWKPNRMPTIFSVEDPRVSGNFNKPTETYCLKINVNHVTVRGLKFLGNPVIRNYHCAIERIGKNRDDLNVTQCLFIGNYDGLAIYCPVIGTGNRLVVENCVFYKSNSGVVFWDGKEAVGGKGHAVRNCIIADCNVSSVWTCQTGEDLVFENNIVSGCKYAWMRKPSDPQKYSMRNCIVTNVKFFSGSGEAFGPFQATPEDIVFFKERVVEEGKVILERRKDVRNYLHVVPGTLGSDMGAGLFRKSTTNDRSTQNQAIQRTH